MNDIQAAYTTASFAIIEAETRILRALAERLEARLNAMEFGNLTGGIARAAKTTTLGTYPTTALLTTFVLAPQDVTGTQTEGATGTITSPGGTFFAVCLSATLPPISTEVIAYDVGTCWVFI